MFVATFYADEADADELLFLLMLRLCVACHDYLLPRPPRRYLTPMISYAVFYRHRLRRDGRGMLGRVIAD